MTEEGSTFTWRGRVFGDPRQPVIVAEMAWAHDGSVEKALRIVDACADAGADALNLHLTDLPSYMVRAYGSGPGRVSAGKDTKPMFDYLGEIALSRADWTRVAARIHERGLLLSTMCNDEASLASSDSLEPDLHVLAPACVGDERFLKALASRGVPVVVSVGGSTLEEIEASVATCRAAGVPGVIIQYGYQAYPTSPADLDLGYMRTLRDTFGCPVGYHDHTDAEIPAARYLPLVALGAGASVIEKHVTHDRSLKGEDHESAFVGAELADLVAVIKSCAAALGTGRWRPLTEGEIKYRQTVRKRMVAAADLPAGAPLEPGAFTFKRSDQGLTAGEARWIAGRSLRKAKAAGEPIEWQDVG